jgi:sugar/nucleoside kinase (ribokinase family)
MNQQVDTLIVGQPSLDINTDYQGNTIHEVGGAVVYSGHAAAALGHRVHVAPKASPKTIDSVALFADNPNIEVTALPSPESTSIENIYQDANKERRLTRMISRIDPYTIAELPNIQARIRHLAGLMVGDISDDLIDHAADMGAIAVDAQCLLRHANGSNGEMYFRDWDAKRDLLPKITFFKTDAAEAEILTGISDRFAAAQQLFDWGAHEVMVTHNTEVLIYDGQEFYTQPLRPRNLSGRSGRGDSCFSAYITERLDSGIPTALRTAAALVSLKMEKPGPFDGNREDVEAFAKAFID